MIEVEFLNEPWNPDYAAELTETIHRSRPLRAALAQVKTAADDLNSLTSVNLTTEEGLKEAIERQGRVRGIYHALTTLLELQESEDERPS